MSEETGWVIEKWINSTLHYWTGQHLGTRGSATGFSIDNLEAVRFSRHQDAAMVLSWLLGGEGRVAEHAWVDGKPNAT